MQVQTVNGVPAYNVYGQPSMIPNKKGDMFDFTPFDTKAQRTLQNAYTYWDHFDYIFDQAEQRGIYIGMVCIWGGLVKAGLMDVQQAKAYGKFLAERYGNRPNVVWIIGGDQRGDVKPEVWEALANTSPIIPLAAPVRSPGGTMPNGSTSICSSRDTVAMASVAAMAIRPTLPRPRRTTGATSRLPTSSSRSSPSSMPSLPTNAFRRACTILPSPNGRRRIVVAMPGGACWQAVADIPMATMP